MTFEFFTNASMDRVEVRSLSGRLFHVAGPVTAKSRRPIVVLLRGMTSVLLSADCSCHLQTLDETGHLGQLSLPSVWDR